MCILCFDRHCQIILQKDCSWYSSFKTLCIYYLLRAMIDSSIFFPFLFFLLNVSFNYLIALDRTSLAMLNRTGKRRHLCPVRMLPPFPTEFIPLYPTLLRFHAPHLKWVLNLSHLLLASVRITICIFSYSVNVLSYTDGLLNIKLRCIPGRRKTWS